MTAPVAERSTAAEIAAVREAALVHVIGRGGLPLAELLDLLVKLEGHRIEITSRALASLLTEGRLDLTPTRTVRPGRSAGP